MSHITEAEFNKMFDWLLTRKPAYPEDYPGAMDLLLRINDMRLHLIEPSYIYMTATDLDMQVLCMLKFEVKSGNVLQSPDYICFKLE